MTQATTKAAKVEILKDNDVEEEEKDDAKATSGSPEQTNDQVTHSQLTRVHRSLDRLPPDLPESQPVVFVVNFGYCCFLPLDFVAVDVWLKDCTC